MIFGLLFLRRHASGIHIFPELRVEVTPNRFRIPDICVTKEKVRGRILREPPFLCIEVLSPEDRAGRIQRKIDDYLAFGVRYVWLIDPGEKRAWSYTTEGRRESAETLTTSDPDLALSLRDIFEALSEDLQKRNAPRARATTGSWIACSRWTSAVLPSARFCSGLMAGK